MVDQVINYTREGCDRTFEGAGREEALVGHVISQHMGFALPVAQAAPAPAAPPAAPKMPTISRPKLSPNCSLVQYKNFLGQWSLYKRGNKIPDDDEIPTSSAPWTRRYTPDCSVSTPTRPPSQWPR